MALLEDAQGPDVIDGSVVEAVLACAQHVQVLLALAGLCRGACCVLVAGVVEAIAEGVVVLCLILDGLDLLGQEPPDWISQRRLDLMKLHLPVVR